MNDDYFKAVAGYYFVVGFVAGIFTVVIAVAVANTIQKGGL